MKEVSHPNKVRSAPSIRTPDENFVASGIQQLLRLVPPLSDKAFPRLVGGFLNLGFLLREILRTKDPTIKMGSCFVVSRYKGSCNF